MTRPTPETDALAAAYSNPKKMREHAERLERQRNIAVEALKYWLPDETWMDEHYPNTDPVCKKHWDKFHEHSELIRTIEEESER